MHQETKWDWCQFITRNCRDIVKVEGNHVMHQETKRDLCQFLTRNFLYIVEVEGNHIMLQETKCDELYNASRKQVCE